MSRNVLRLIGSFALLFVAACGASNATSAPRDPSDAGGPAGRETADSGATGGGQAGSGGAAGATAAGAGGAAAAGASGATVIPVDGGGGPAARDGGDAGAPAGSPVALHGVLTAEGNHVVDAHGQPLQLKGMSLYWSQYDVGAEFYNADVIHWLVQDWHVSIVRAAIAVTGANDGDYLANPNGQLALLDRVVQAAFANGIYVLIDWHDYEAVQHVEAAKTFFSTVSQRYGGRPNVIYEIWNEPKGNEGLTWIGDLKPYAETISKQIRPHDPTNLMVVGTPFWDQQPSSVIGHVVTDPNVAYTLHFYAGDPDHFFSGNIGKDAQAALDGGIPLFVTEWGTTDPNPQTMFNEAQSLTWMAFLDKNSISWCNWAISGANEGSSALRQGASPGGGWKDSDLSQSGAFVRGLLLDM
jgi:endoglucanase